MMNLLIRNVNPAHLKQLKLLAKRHNRTVQEELRCIIEAASHSKNKISKGGARKICASWQRRLLGRQFSDSADLIRDFRSKV